MRIVLQLTFAVLWTAGLILLVIGVYYAVSLLVLGVCSRLFPLTGRRTRRRQPDDSPSKI